MVTLRFFVEKIQGKLWKIDKKSSVPESPFSKIAGPTQLTKLWQRCSPVKFEKFLRAHPANISVHMISILNQRHIVNIDSTLKLTLK